MSLIAIIITLLVVGVLLWLINHKVPYIDGSIKQIINFVVFAVVILWLLKIFGILAYIGNVTV